MTETGAQRATGHAQDESAGVHCVFVDYDNGEIHHYKPHSLAKVGGAKTFRFCDSLPRLPFPPSLPVSFSSLPPTLFLSRRRGRFVTLGAVSRSGRLSRSTTLRVATACGTMSEV